MSTYNFIHKNIRESFTQIKKQPKYFIGSMLMDLLFILSYGFFIFWLMFKVTSNLFLAGKLISQQAALFGQEEIVLTELIKQANAWPNLSNFFLYLLLLILTFYILYCFFQAISWKFCNKLTNNKVDFYNYLKKFFLTNIFWLFLFLIYNIIAFVLDLMYMLQTKSESFPNHPVLFIIFLIFGYFILTSYSLIPNKKTIRESFSLGFKKFKKLVPVFVLILILFALIDFILKISAFNKPLMVILGFLLFFPCLTFSKILFLNSVSKIN